MEGKLVELTKGYKFEDVFLMQMKQDFTTSTFLTKLQRSKRFMPQGEKYQTVNYCAAWT